MSCSCDCLDLGCYLAGDDIEFGINALCDGTFTFEVSRRGLTERIEIDFTAGDPLVLPNTFDEHGEIKVKIKLPSACAEPENGFSYVTARRGECCFKFKNDVPRCGVSGGSNIPAPPVAVRSSFFDWTQSGTGGPLLNSIGPSMPPLPDIYRPTFGVLRNGVGDYSILLQPPRLIGAPYIDYFGPTAPEGSAVITENFDDGDNEWLFEPTFSAYRMDFTAKKRASGSSDPFVLSDDWGNPFGGPFFRTVFTDFE